MKNTCAFWTLVAACLLLVLSGCRGPLGQHGTAGNESGTGSLSLSISRQGLGRTIMPETTLGDFVEFRLEFAAMSAGNTDFGISWTSDGTLGSPDTITDTVALHAGTWNLYVRAYLAGGDGDEARKAAVGSIEGIEIPARETVAGNVRLYPIPQGKGRFSWDIGFPENVARIEIVVTDPSGANIPGLGAIIFDIPAGETEWADYANLPAGRYRAIFTLINKHGERAVASEILHVYQNMESNFARTFGGQHFIVPLLNTILNTWDGSRWNLVEEGIRAEYFYLLGIKGVYADNFAAIADWFTDLASPATVPNNLEGLKALVDAALIGMGADADFAARSFANRAEAQASIAEWPANGTVVRFVWVDDYTLTLVLGVYEVKIVFDNAVLLPGAPVPGLTLYQQLAWLRNYAQSGNRYLVELSGDETIVPLNAALPIGRNDLVISLRGTGQMRYLSLGATGNLFTVDAGVTLVLAENITLMGRGPTANPPTASNNTQLLRVNSGGTLVMNWGSRITGNTVTSPLGVDNAGGVRVNAGGRFVMYGGEISRNNFNASFNHGGGVDVFGGTFEMRDGIIYGNNTNGSAGGGGVRVHAGGIFRMSGGLIYGSDAPAGFPNTTATGVAASLSLAVGATVQHGTFGNGAFNLLGDFTSKVRTIEVRNGVLIRPVPLVKDFVRVDGGTFLMGSCPTGQNTTPMREVTLSGFYMSRFQLTQGEWYDVMGTNPSNFHGGHSAIVAAGANWRNLPVEQVSWYDAIVFSNWLSIQRGLTPAYSINGSTNPDDWGSVPTSSNATWNAVVVVPGSTGYRLPTEAQWEFAARGGIVCQGNFVFSGSDTAGEVAWYGGNSGGRTHEVGTRQPNALSLYDMSGNVLEWVWDWSGAYPNFPETDPTGASSGSFRVYRGGNWFISDWEVRSAFRNLGSPAARGTTLGFRLVRPFPPLQGTVSITGIPQVGQTLTANTANLVGSGDISFQWRRGTANVGTNSSTHVLGTADLGSTITVTVIRADNSGSVTSPVGPIVADTDPTPSPGFIRVDGGTFLMGSCPTGQNATPMREVTLSGFYMSRFQLTQGEWYDVMGTRPSFFDGTNVSGAGTATTTFEWRNLPVETVSWYDAIVFSNRLSIKRGLTPAYSINGSANPDDWGPVPVPPNWNNPIWAAVVVVPGSTGYRLPTEAQWEFAARGGIVCQGNYTFSGSDTAADVAWFTSNSGGRTHEVGTRRPNALGLYDMSGNVFERVWDRWGTYPNFPETDPTGASSGSNRVIRGGGWNGSDWYVRSAARISGGDPAIRSSHVGFRLVRP